MKFWSILKNDLLGQEDKSKEIATLKERIRYTEYMALGFLTVGLVLCAINWWWFGIPCLVVAARKAWIAADKEGWID